MTSKENVQNIYPVTRIYVFPILDKKCYSLVASGISKSTGCPYHKNIGFGQNEEEMYEDAWLRIQEDMITKLEESTMGWQDKLIQDVEREIRNSIDQEIFNTFVRCQDK